MVYVLSPRYCQDFTIRKQVEIKTEDAGFGAIRDCRNHEYRDAQWLAKDESSALVRCSPSNGHEIKQFLRIQSNRHLALPDTRLLPLVLGKV